MRTTPHTILTGMMALAMTALMAGCKGDEPEQTTPTPKTVAVTGVSINKSSTTLEVGGSETLTATVAPDNATNKSVSWTSSNTDAATVNSNGNVMAVKPGTATITVTTSDGSKTATCTVTVKDNKVAVEKIALDFPNKELFEGESFTLTATITPENATDQSVTWRSSDTKVATVDDKGVVKAVSYGSAEITVTSANGLKATCSVTVKRDTSLKGIAFEEKSLEINVGASAYLTVVYTPEYAEHKVVVWRSSASDVATVSSEGEIKGLKVGKATITAISEDGGHKATCEVNVTSVAKAGVYWTEGDRLIRDGQDLETRVIYGACVDPSGSLFYYSDFHVWWDGSKLFEANPSVSGGALSAAGGGFFYITSFDGERKHLDAWKMDVKNKDMWIKEVYKTSVKNGVWLNDTAADSNGNLYIAGREVKSDKTSIASLWKLDTNEKVTQTRLSSGTTNSAESCDAVAVNSKGDVYCLVWDGTYGESHCNLYLYKNGTKQYLVTRENSRLSSCSCDIAVLGDDVYILVCEYAGDGSSSSSRKTRVRMYKNKKTLYDLLQGDYAFCTDVFVTSKGDVYCSGYKTKSDNTPESYIWKNGKLLYTRNHYIGIRSLVVKE